MSAISANGMAMLGQTSFSRAVNGYPAVRVQLAGPCRIPRSHSLIPGPVASTLSVCPFWGRGQICLRLDHATSKMTRRRGLYSPINPKAVVQAETPPSSAGKPADELKSISQPELHELPATNVQEGSSFEWKSNWYAVQVVEHMDPGRPHPVSVLGRPFVLWRDKEGEWRCFVDECPHRLVPLSEGRIDEAGRLQCSYHGWAFDGTGACQAIPQAQKEGPEAKAVFSPRACAVAVPTAVAQGLLFIWPDEHGWVKAKATLPPVIPELEDSGYRIRGTMRDLEYGYEMLAENVMDLSHLPFAHHGVGFLRRTQGKPLPFVLAAFNGAAGYQGSCPTDVFPSKKLQLEFQSPSRFTYNREVAFGGQGGSFYTNLFITPTAPGRSRIIIHSASNLKLPRIASLKPEFMYHHTEQNILDGDAFFLHAQEKALVRRRADPTQWAQHYFMPASADRYVVAFRQWLAKYAGGAVQYVDGVDPTLSATWAPREHVMDRLNGHTKHCTTCSTALKNFLTAQKALAAACLVLLAAAAIVRGALLLKLGLAAGALVAAGVAFWIQDYIQIFIYKGWDHATR